MKRPVIILDVDGPLIPERAYFLPGPKLPGQFDPIAVQMIERVARETDAQYVISSTKRKHGLEYCYNLFTANGFDCRRFHPNWATPIDPPDLGLPYQFGRTAEIYAWLTENQNSISNYVAIDDEGLDPEFVKNHILVTFNNGFLYEHYEKLREILGLKKELIILPFEELPGDEDFKC